MYPVAAAPRRGENMQTSKKILLMAVAIGLPAFVLTPGAPVGQMVWPEVHGPEPTGPQIALLMLYSALSSLAMGVAIGYLAFGFEWTRRIFTRWSAAAHLAIVFIPGSYWIHDSLHMINGENMAGLIALEYGFHLPGFAAGTILMVAAAKTVQARAVRRAPQPAAAAVPR